MMKLQPTSNVYKIVEFILIFILAPISFAFNYAVQIKTVIGVLGLLYILFVLFKIEKLKVRKPNLTHLKKHFKIILIRGLVIIITTIIFVWFTDKNVLFYVPQNNPRLWGIILFVYSFFSVFPQELMYRTFYFSRYKSIFKNTTWLIFINALVFSIAHVLFKNTLVLLITFIGGLLFALSYYKTKSTMYVTLEHAIYGCWLFTVGMGDMLGFPS